MEKRTKPQPPAGPERINVPGSRGKSLLRLRVSEDTTLLPFLLQALSDKSRTTVKQLLHDRFIAIGNEPTTQFDAPLKAGDIVQVHPAPLPKQLHHTQLNVLYQDEWLVVVYKDAGLPTVASGEEKDKTVLRLLSEHLKSFNPLAKVYHVNRLDKDSAGIVVFAKSKELQQELSEHWGRYVRSQHFTAVVEGHLSPEQGTLTPPAPQEDTKGKKGLRTKRRGKASDEEQLSQAGLASYRVLSASPERSLVSIELLKGRNNKLRRQFAALRCPIVGDWRSGSSEAELGRVALEGTHLTLTHPVTRELLDFRRPIPPLFRKLLRSLGRLDSPKGKRPAKPSPSRASSSKGAASKGAPSKARR